MIVSKRFWATGCYSFVGIFLQTVGFVYLIIEIFDFSKLLGEPAEKLGLYILPVSLVLALLVFAIKSINGIKYKIEPEVLKMDKDFSDSLVTQDEIKSAEELIAKWDDNQIPTESSQYYASKYRCQSYLKEAQEFNDKLQQFMSTDGAFYVINFAITNNSPLYDESVHFAIRLAKEDQKDHFQIIPDFQKLSVKPFLLPESYDSKVSHTAKMFERKPNIFQKFFVVNEDSIDFEFTDFRGETTHHVFQTLNEIVVFTNLKKIKLNIEINSKLKSKWSRQTVWLNFENVKHVKERFNNND